MSDSLKRTIILLHCAMFFSLIGLGQDNKVDSMLSVLKNLKEDTNKVNTLNELSKRYIFRVGDYDMSKKYAEQAVALATNINYPTGLMYAYTNLAFTYDNLGNYTDALRNFQLVLKVADETGNLGWKGSTYNNIGMLYSDQGQPEQAIKYYTISVGIIEKSGDKRKLANSYYNIGNTYYSPLSNFIEAIKAQSMSLKLSNEIGDKGNVVSRYIDIGNNYESLGNYPEAISNYLAALKLAEEIGARGNVGSAYNNIGEIYNDEANYEEALIYYAKGLKVFQEINNKGGISVSYDNIGEVYQKQGKFSEAIQNHLAALKIGEEIKYNYGMAYSYRNLGNAYFLQAYFDEALKNYFSSLKLFKKIEDVEGIAKANQNIGETYFKMNNSGEARKYYIDAVKSANEFHGKKILKDTYEDLARLDSATGNWKEAYEHQKLFALYHDSLVNQENSNKIMENMMRYEFGKKEDSLNYKQTLTDEKLKQQVLLARQQKQDLLLKDNELVMLNKEKEIQKLQLQKNQVDYALQKSEADKKQEQLSVLNKEKTIQSLDLKKQKQEKKYFIVGLILFLVLSFFVYNGYRIRQKLKLQTLRNKIASDLHDDVGSTLSSISIFSQMALEETKEVRPMLQTIGESSRKMLDAMADIVWTINPENDQFENIIMRMRSFAYELLGAKHIEFRFVTDSNIANIKLSMEARRNLYLIFKEATNNLVKYADATQAMFSIKEDKGKLVMMIKDNGKGFDSSQDSKGNGLKNMKKRATELGAVLSIDSLPGTGTTIQLELAV